MINWINEEERSLHRKIKNAWLSMRSRCTNPNHPQYHRYGGRGITICEEWNDFLCFKEWCLNNGCEPGLQIDRINNNSGYSPENCRWVTQKENLNNRRSNRKVTIAGLTKNIQEWADFAGIHEETLTGRINKGCSEELLLSPPGTLPPRRRDTRKYKLTEEQVRQIYNDPRMLKEIAADYNVTIHLVSRIKNRKVWKKALSNM